MKRDRPTFPKILLMHYSKLVSRGALFLMALAAYLANRIGGVEIPWIFPSALWVIFAIALLLRFFPSSLESMGCQKPFARNYLPKEGDALPTQSSWRSTAAVAAAWLLLNGVIGALYFLGVIDRGILILISLAYSVCDIICILFFCPFQTWFMKNRCCTTCRIYNWDFPMMFTPLVFIPSVYTYTLVGGSLLLLLRWELALRRHPERFSPETNASLDCANCKEKLCRHKKQLRSFLKKRMNEEKRKNKKYLY